MTIAVDLGHKATKQTNLPAGWIILQAFVVKINFFEKLFQEYHHCQTVWIQIRLDFLLGPIWVQTVCKCYQQMTLVHVGKKFNPSHQSQLQQTKKFVTSLEIFEKKSMIFHENCLPADDSHEISCLIWYF